MGEVFVGSEALQQGRVTEYELRRHHRALLPNVYMAKEVEASLRDRTVAAWLWSRRRGVIAGAAASALHGAPWVDANVPIDIVLRTARPRPGLIIRKDTLTSDETTKVAGLPVTTVVRTAFDLGRHLPREQAVARLDALAWARRFSIADVQRLAERQPGARGVRRLREVLPLVDGGAASPMETWLRLLLVDAGFPVPTTQIPMYCGRQLIVLDMGWPQFKVAVEYDGDHHRTDRRQYVKDLRRVRALENIGWILIRVVAEDRPDEVIARVREALRRRGFTESYLSE